MTRDALPTREEILRFVAESPGKVGKREIARAFNVKGGDRIGLKSMLADLADEGLIAKSGKRMRPPGELPRVTLLAVAGRTPDGELYAEPASWDEAEGKKPRVVLLGARPAPGLGDRLLARITKADDGALTGKVIKVIERRPAKVLAVVERTGRTVTLLPTSKKERDSFAADPEAVKDIESGTLVRIDPARGRYAKIVEVIGPLSSEKAVSLLAIHAHGIPDAFSDAVLAEAAAAPAADPSGREDWTAIPFLTIDPPDAKDHDDAVHAAPRPAEEGGGHIVSVAIADVAAYVRPGSAMDREARKRGNSTYFPDRVVPMLPERISNDLCSLREGEVRPALAMRMAFAPDGRMAGHTVHRVLIRSARRLAYGDAQQIADGTESDVSPIVAALYEAYACLKKGRDGRQPMELDLPERKILLTPEGAVDRVIVPERLDAHKLIEEFMIQANVAAALTAEKAGLGILYRVHDAPALDKVDALREFLGTLDIRLARGTRLRPEHFNGILAKVDGTPHAQLVNEVVLRTQAQAEYSPQNLGHFGLNLRRYAHFTSPIRRYADLIVHRAIIRAENLGNDGLTDAEIAELGAIGTEISATERRSMVAERETIDRLIAAHLADSVGATFPGRIAGVTKAGLFIKLSDTGADGFIPISTLGLEYMIYDETQHALIGEASGTAFRLGDTVVVRLLEAAPVSGALRFEIVEHDAGPKIRRPRRAPAKKGPRFGRKGRR
ncbi:MAG: ribonuclease R [Pseudomonadota bacterium]